MAVLGVCAGGDEPRELVIHEWGVVSVPGLPAEARSRDLPDFIVRPSDVASEPMPCPDTDKPVLYFYPPAEIVSANVRVRFPGTTPTAWWPDTLSGGVDDKNSRLPVGGPRRSAGSLQWQVMWNAGRGAPTPQPQVPEGHWIRAAREVDAPMLDVGGQNERFLFYEGAFDSYVDPVRAEIHHDGDATGYSVDNAGDPPLLDAILVVLDESGLRVVDLGTVEPGSRCWVDPPGLAREMEQGNTSACIGETVSSEDAERCLVRSLVAAGLYGKEAAAMAHIWREAFFGREGVRVIYRWPQEVYDRTLPLEVETTPAGIPVRSIRVMLVCREIMPAADSARLAALIASLGATDFAERERAMEDLARHGRAAEAVLREAVGSSDPEVSARARVLLDRIEEAACVTAR